MIFWAIQLRGGKRLAHRSRRAGGLIQKHTSERLLVEIFGPENVRREIIPQADGQELAGTVVFPADPLRRSEIFWRDPSTRSSPTEVHVFGEKTHWR